MLLVIAFLPLFFEDTLRAVFFLHAFVRLFPSIHDPISNNFYALFSEDCLNSLLFFSDATCRLIFFKVIEVFSLIFGIREIHSSCTLAIVVSAEIELLSLTVVLVIL
jgi:hypothetical protein